MFKKLLSLALVAFFTISLAGTLLAADIQGKVTKTEREGRYITVTADDGSSAKVRISSSSTDLMGVDDRSDIKVGQMVSTTYDESDDRKTAESFTVKK